MFQQRFLIKYGNCDVFIDVLNEVDKTTPKLIVKIRAYSLLCCRVYL